MKTTLRLVAIGLLLLGTFTASAFFDPAIGRWASRDTAGEAGGNNLQAFVENRPVGSVDVFGQWHVTVHLLMTARWGTEASITPGYAAIIGVADNDVDAVVKWESSLPLIGQPGRHMKHTKGGGDSRDYYFRQERDRAIKYLHKADAKQDLLLCIKAAEHFGKGLHSLQDKSAHRDWPAFLGGGDWDYVTMHPAWWDAWEEYEYEYWGLSEGYWKRKNPTPSLQAEYYPWAKDDTEIQDQQRASQDKAKKTVESDSRKAFASFVEEINKTCICRQRMLINP